MTTLRLTSCILWVFRAFATTTASRSFQRFRPLALRYSGTHECFSHLQVKNHRTGSATYHVWRISGPRESRGSSRKMWSRGGRARALPGAALTPTGQEVRLGEPGREGNGASFGVDVSAFRSTLVPGLAGAVIKQSPQDFVVVEMPLSGGSQYTAANARAPLSDAVKKPNTQKMPVEHVLTVATDEWRERWPMTSDSFSGEGEQDQMQQNQIQQHLGEGFDAVATYLGASATIQLQDWLLSIAKKASFDAAEARGDGSNADVFLPPPSPPKRIRLACPPDLDKAGRTRLHGIFKTHMPYCGTRAIMPDASGGPSDGNGTPPAGVPSTLTFFEISLKELTKNSDRQSWPFGKREHLEFSMYKAGRSTHEAADILCRRLNVKRSRLSYAGAKDRRAITAQKMRCWRLEAEDLHEAQASGSLAEEGVAVSDLSYVEGDLKLGQLEGNHFEMLLRPPAGGWGVHGTGSPAATTAAAVGGGVSAGEAFRYLRDKGLINFFGPQRFGRDGTNSVDVGIRLLRSDWPGAVARILAYHPADTREVAAAKEAYFGENRDRGDLSAALRLLPRSAFLERVLLSSLQDTEGRDHLAALLALPRPMRLLFAQAYQSLLWNEAASARMCGSLDRLKAVEGDLVLMAGDRPLTAWETRCSDEGQSDIGAEQDRGRGRGRAGRGKHAGRGGRSRGGAESLPQQRVITVSAEQASEGTFGIEHVVIPLAGHSVTFPTNAVGAHMASALRRDGLGEVILRGHPQREFDLKGAYRHVVMHPRHLSVRPVPLDDAAGGDVDEVLSDRAATGGQGMALSDTATWLRKYFRNDISRRFRGATAATADDKGNQSAGLASTTAVRVSFALPLGSYATTLLQHLTGEGINASGEQANAGFDGDERSYDG